MTEINQRQAPSIQKTSYPTLTLDDLPPVDTKRWVMRRKAQVVAAVDMGLLTLDDACARYTLSHEEFASWQALIRRHGVRGLRATRLQQYRVKQDFLPD